MKLYDIEVIKNDFNRIYMYIHIYIYIYMHVYIFLTVCTCGSLDVSFVATSIHRMFTRTRTNSRWAMGDQQKQANERYIPGRQSIAEMGFIWRSVVSLRSCYYRSGTRQVTYSPQQTRIRKNKVHSDLNQAWSSVQLVPILFSCTL